MKSKIKMLMAGMALATGVAASGGAGAYAVGAETLVTTLDGLETCLQTAGSVCKLDADISSSSGTYIDIASGVNVALDLNGHSLLYTGDNSYGDIQNSGNLGILDSGANGQTNFRFIAKNSGVIGISGGTFGGAIYTANDASAAEINIIGGVFNNYISGSSGNSLTITGGVFNNYVSSDGVLLITDGSFGDYIAGKGDTTIENGEFGGHVTLYGNAIVSDGTFGVVSIGASSDVQIFGGTYSDTLFGGNSNSRIVIAGGEFTDMNFITYEEGSSLEISGGSFAKGFSIGVEKLSITGGTFYNGDSSDGWMFLNLERPDVQEYSITGGTFLNTGDDYGVLMVVHTSVRPTLDMIRALFAGGTVLDENTMTIELDDGDEPYYSYIKKARTDGEGADIAVPNTGVFSGNGGGVAAMVSLGVVALGGAYAVFYAVKRRGAKVKFEKKLW